MTHTFSIVMNHMLFLDMLNLIMTAIGKMQLYISIFTLYQFGYKAINYNLHNSNIRIIFFYFIKKLFFIN